MHKILTPPRTFLALGALNGLLAVALGAFGAHALKDVLSPGLLLTFGKAVDYQAMHAMALLAVGILQRDARHPRLNWAGWLFASGILLFSGSLYILALTDIRWLGAITPFGGTAFIVGWALLAWHYWRE